MEDIKLNGNFLVTLHNDLIQARFSDSLSTVEQKILFSVLSNIEPPEYEMIDGKRVVKEKVTEIKPFRVPIKEFTNFLGVKDPNYAYFKSTIKKLMKKLIEIQQQDGSWRLFQWVTYAEYKASEGLAEIKISPELYPYLLNLESNFTKTKLDVLLSFNSVYSSRLYQLVKKWSKLGSWKVELDELKNLIGVPIESERNGVKEFKLARYNHFKTRALEVALKEVNKYSEFDVSITEHKKVRKISAITFHIKTKTKKQNKKEDSLPENNTKKDDPTPKESEYGSDFLEKYRYDSGNKRYVEISTSEPVLFDGRDRVKAIILENKFNGIDNSSLFKIEDILSEIVDIHEFDIVTEVHFLFGYTKNSDSIKNPSAFICSTLNKIKNEVIKGNYDVTINNVINIRDFKREILPDWFYEGLKSKEVEEEKGRIKEELGRLEGTELTVSKIRTIELYLSIKGDSYVENLNDKEKKEYEEYIKLKGNNELEELINRKKEELKEQGLWDNNSNDLKANAVEQVYKNKMLVSV